MELLGVSFSGLQRDQILRGRAGYGLQVQPGIKADEAALVAHGQPQQIAVRDLTMPQQVLPVHLIGVQQAVVVGHKGVCGVRMV